MDDSTILAYGHTGLWVDGGSTDTKIYAYTSGVGSFAAYGIGRLHALQSDRFNCFTPIHHR